MALQNIEVTCPSSQEAPRDTSKHLDWLFCFCLLQTRGFLSCFGQYWANRFKMIKYCWRKLIKFCFLADGNFVETLQESLSQMIERNAQCERRITGLMSENNILTNDLESCTARNEQFEAQNSELRQNLTTIEESLGSSQSEHNKTTQKFQHCLRTRKFFMNHAVRMAVDLRERPTQEQYQRQIRALTEARDSREQGLLRCQATQNSVIRKATQCVKKLRDTLNRVETLNETCTQEKATQQSQFDALLQGENLILHELPLKKKDSYSDSYTVHSNFQISFQCLQTLFHFYSLFFVIFLIWFAWILCMHVITKVQTQSIKQSTNKCCWSKQQATSAVSKAITWFDQRERVLA